MILLLTAVASDATIPRCTPWPTQPACSSRRHIPFAGHVHVARLQPGGSFHFLMRKSRNSTTDRNQKNNTIPSRIASSFE